MSSGAGLVSASLRTCLLLAALFPPLAFRASAARLLDEYTLRRWTTEEGLPETRVVRVEQSDDGFLWCTTPRFNARFDGARFVVAPRTTSEPPHPPIVSPQDTPPNLTPRDVVQIARGDGDELWALTRKALFLRRDAAWQRIEPPTAVRDGADRLTTLLADGTGALWAGSVHGVHRFDRGQWSDVTGRDGIVPWDVRSMAMDRDRNVWIGTGGGLVRLRRKRLQVFRTGQAAGTETITALLVESPTNLWVGLAGSGLLAGPPSELRPVQVGTLSQRITISSLLRGRDGTLWVGTQGDGLWRWRDNEAHQVQPAAGTPLDSQGISALLEDRRGVLWVGTWDGLMQLNRAGALAPVPGARRTGERRMPPADMVQALFEDSAGKVWAGYQNTGLACFHPRGGVQHYDRASGLPGDGIRSLFQDAEGVFWIGTTRGLARWQDGIRHAFTTTDGLVDNSILQILEDDLGHLWLGTRRGILRIKKTEFTDLAAGRRKVLATRVLGVDAGMLDPECTGRMGARAGRTSDGRLWFPTTDGIVMADPREIRSQPPPAPPLIEEVRAAGHAHYTAPLLTLSTQPDPTRTVHLPRGLRAVDFRFTAPLLTAPERVHFKFQLSGHDGDWSRAAPERTAPYASLSPGSYVFRVMVRDRDGEWSPPAAIRVVVPPFLWETVGWWVGVIVVAVAGMVGIVHALDRRQAIRRMRILEQEHAVERERGRIARDIHDDVGAGLTEMAMLSELAQSEALPANEKHEHLDRIFQRAGQLTQSLDEIVWAINPANDSMESLVAYVGDFAQNFLGAAGVVCRLHLPPSPPPLALGSGVRHHLCLAVKEALHNIVKHAGAGEVTLSIDLAGAALSIRIEDNGRGFADAAAGGVSSGHDGLANLETRIREIGGHLHRESRPGRGTLLVLSVELPTPPVEPGAAGFAGKQAR